jgi:hypothetical protein
MVSALKGESNVNENNGSTETKKTEMLLRTINRPTLTTC